MNAKKTIQILSILAVSAAMLCAAWFISQLVQQNERLAHIGDRQIVFHNAVMDMRFQISQVQQFYTDASATGERDAMQEADQSAESFRKSMKEARATADADASAQLSKMESSFEKFYAQGRQMAETYITSGRDAGNKVMESFDKVSLEISDLATQLADAEKTNTQTELAQITQSNHLLVVYAVVLTVGVLLGTMAGIWVIFRKILNPLEKIRQTMTEVERTHKLTIRASGEGTDEIGQLAVAFNQLLASMQEVLKSFSVASGKIGEEASTLTQSASTASDVANRQQEAAQSMAAAMEELSVGIDQIADNTRHTRDVTQTNRESSVQGSKILQASIRDMAAVESEVRNASDTIRTLGEQSGQISGIAGEIKEIADQTNLLALNAAIEAARAGEQGRGFAVVADEVRKLAERTGQSTGEISQRISAIQESVSLAIERMDVIVNKVQNGASTLHDSGAAMNEIEKGTQLVTNAIDDISLTLNEQSAAGRDIAAHVETVAEISERNHAASQNVAAVAEDLESLSRELQIAVEKFSV